MKQVKKSEKKNKNLCQFLMISLSGKLNLGWNDSQFLWQPETETRMENKEQMKYDETAVCRKALADVQ